MPDRAEAVLLLLQDVEREMRGLGLWSDEAPEPERLASKMPFCYDTLPFPEWLQWVFLPKLRVMLELHQALPHKCNIAPLADEWFKAQGIQQDARKLQEVIRDLDRLLSASWR